jgi:tRNA(Ile)-lysidine synthetase-like protein
VLEAEDFLSQEKVVQSALSWIRDKRLCAAKDRVLLAVSGGLDSSVLLHIMVRLQRLLQIELAVAHVNHGTRGLASAQERTWVRVHAERLRLPFFELSVPPGLPVHAELALREARRELLVKLAEKENFNKIATAHHAQDNVETLLMRLMSGTGSGGLAGIRPKQGLWIRPLLPLMRGELESYAGEHGIACVEDPSNARGDTLRNALRLDMLPRLESLRQGSLKNLARLAQRLDEEEDELAQMLGEDLEQSPDFLSLQKLERWPKALRRRLVTLWVRRLGLDHDPSLIEALLGGADVVHRRGSFLRRSDMLIFTRDAEFGRAWEQPMAVEFGRKLSLGPSLAWSFLPDPRAKPFVSQDLSVYFVFRAPGMKNSPLRMDWDLLPWPLVIRARRHRERLPELDDMLQRAKIPKPYAAQWPLLVSQKQPDLVVGGVGIGVFDAYRLKRRARSVSMECFFEEGLKRSLETC